VGKVDWTIKNIDGATTRGVGVHDGGNLGKGQLFVGDDRKAKATQGKCFAKKNSSRDCGFTGPT